MKKYQYILIFYILFSFFVNCEEKPDDTTLGFINEDEKVLLAGMLFLTLIRLILLPERLPIQRVG
ncbi:hypothetical protein LEP1GSC150_2634 [Leptospira interrogans serovar Copenhageni str. LT2050]|uniref:Uncharacterized protein n=1 Tax=Leptospira interrogans serovar Copenhageni str. LT2050 TaxID=1001598 RepID=M3IUD2_LEPIT|nr:hypothetical protein LEP1GSC150_2634 [Leptospira interrogans serovar Copenhageni str. LT2050]